MKLRFPEFPEGAWIRTCQECGKKQAAVEPKTEKSLARKCVSCKSEALDYGQNNTLSDYGEEDEE